MPATACVVWRRLHAGLKVSGCRWQPEPMALNWKGARSGTWLTGRLDGTAMTGSFVLWQSEDPVTSQRETSVVQLASCTTLVSRCDVTGSSLCQSTKEPVIAVPSNRPVNHVPLRAPFQFSAIGSGCQRHPDTFSPACKRRQTTQAVAGKAESALHRIPRPHTAAASTRRAAARSGPAC